MSTHDEFRNDSWETGRDETTALPHEDPTVHGAHDTRQGQPDTTVRVPRRPKGPSWGTVALGLVCLVVAGGAFWVEWAGLDLDWTRSGPLGLVGLGTILVLVGLAALARRGDDERTDP